MPGFMRNSYLDMRTVFEAAKLVVSGLQDFCAENVSATVGCIDRVLPSTLRWAPSRVLVET